MTATDLHDVNGYPVVPDHISGTYGYQTPSLGDQAEARRLMAIAADQDDHQDNEQGHETVEAIRQRIVVGAGIANLPRPEPVAQELLYRPSVAAIYGPPGGGKTHMAIALACAVATGAGWLGHITRPGRVLYVAAEGVGGIGARVAAWCEHYGRDDLDRLSWLPMATNLGNAETVDALVEIAPDFDVIIFDTLARCSVGSEENSAKDMGIIVAALDRIRDACGGLVLIVHHTGKDVTRGARGSNALLGALDTELLVTGDSNGITMKVTKQKDAPESAPVYARLVDAADSVVAVGASGLDPDADSTRSVLAAIEALDDGTGVATGVLVEEMTEEMSRPTVQRARAALVDSGQIFNAGSDGRPRWSTTR